MKNAEGKLGKTPGVPYPLHRTGPRGGSKAPNAAGGHAQEIYFGFQTFHTLPTKSGPGLSVGSPGCQPAGVASFPLEALTS